MKMYSLILLSCLSLLFITQYSEAQTVPPSNATSSKEYSQLLEKQFFKTGNDLFDQGNYENAITYYDKALNINSTDINVLYNKALALDSLGRLNDAIVYYDKALAINPNDTDSLNNKGLDLDVLGKHGEAITYYDKILTINPVDTDALYNKGIALDNLGKHDEAISYYKEVLAINPNDTSALNKLNLTSNSVNNNEIGGIQKINQTSPIGIGIIISLVIAIIVISLVRRKARKELAQTISKVSVPIKKDEEKSIVITEIQEEKPKPEEIKDNEWKGV